ncbi:MAG: energy transducer TonB [Dokdonella sp.]
MGTVAGDISRSTNRWSWLRTTSIALAMALHLSAITLLAMPEQTPSPRTPGSEPIATVQLIESVPAPVALPVPDEPRPPLRAPQPKRPPAIATIPALPVPTVPRVDAAHAATDVDVSASAAPVQYPRASTPSTEVTLAYETIVSPQYPHDAKRRGERGTVLLTVLVDRDGRPTQIEVERSSGSPRLDRAAREAVQQWRFRPVQINGVAVPARGTVPIAFTLESA